MAGGKRFEYGSLRCLFSNRLYVGEIQHKGRIYQGRHEAILDRAVFDDAQAILATLNKSAVCGPKLVSASLLQGLMVDRHGRTMGPVHTTRSGQRFRYYVTHPKARREGDPVGYRVAASSIESAASELLVDQLRSRVTNVDAHAAIEEHVATLNGRDQRAKRELILAHFRKVIIGDAMITVEFNDGTILERSSERVRHGNDAKLVIGAVELTGSSKAAPQLIILLRDAHRARAMVETKPNFDLDRLAKLFGRSTERFKRLLRLSYLSPTLVEATIAGRQPARMTNRFLQNLDGLPLGWAEQEALLLG